MNDSPEERETRATAEELSDFIDVVESTVSERMTASYMRARLERIWRRFSGYSGQIPLPSPGYRMVRELAPGDHAWLVSSRREELNQVLGQFIGAGLDHAEKVVCVTDVRPHRLPGLAERRELVSASSGGPRGLSVVPWKETTAGHGPEDPSGLVRTLEREVSRALDQRFQRVRIVVDMHEAANMPDGERFLLACGDEVDTLITRSSELTGISHTDSDGFSAETLDSLYEKLLVGADPEYDDGVLRITRTYAPYGLRLEGEIDGARHHVFTRTLTSVGDQGGEVHLELANLRFIDLGALNLLSAHALTLTGGEGLILDNPTPELESVFEVVGFDRLPGITQGHGWRARRGT